MGRAPFLCLCLMPLFLSGCNTLPKGFGNDSPQLVAEPDKVSALLADAAGRATNALEQLAAVEQARTPRVSPAPVGDAPEELRRAVTTNWIGPVEQVVEKLANRAGYQFEAIGDKPVTPIVVSLDVANEPIINVLRNIGLQLGKRADIRVDGERSIVEIQYPPHDSPSVGIGG